MGDPFTIFIDGIMELNKAFVFVNNKPEFQSGGNIYNNQIGESLQKLGHTVFHTKDIYAKDFINYECIIILDSIIIDENLDLDFYKNQIDKTKTSNWYYNASVYKNLGLDE